MSHVGIDIEQFVTDTYGSGIQRVLQYLAKEWPSDEVSADFVVPVEGGFGLLTPQQATELLSVPFAPRDAGTDLRLLVRAFLDALDVVTVKPGDLLALYDAWILPEVSYLPSVLQRFEVFSACLPTLMIGYDTLPMSEPANYRFKPGSAAWVSEYFRHLAGADSVVCISDYARASVLDRLRRDRALPISVAHPGGDHLEAREGIPPTRPTFTRLGTLEARKNPREILSAFTEAVRVHRVEADLVFIGAASASDEGINNDLRRAIDAGLPVRWIQDAADATVYEVVQRSSAFLSIGTEGFGIPVLEALRLGTPVLFDGVQPAAELMAGRGARRVAALTHADLVDLFVDYSIDSACASARLEVDPEAVPTWSAFARAVVESIRL